MSIIDANGALTGDILGHENAGCFTRAITRHISMVKHLGHNPKAIAEASARQTNERADSAMVTILPSPLAGGHSTTGVGPGEECECGSCGSAAPRPPRGGSWFESLCACRPLPPRTPRCPRQSRT